MALDVLVCPDCGERVSENWLTRHRLANCEVGAKGDKVIKYKKFAWHVRPEHGQKIRVWNKPLERWENMIYLMEDGGTLLAEDGWTGKVSKFGKFLYPRWSE